MVNDYVHNPRWIRILKWAMLVGWAVITAIGAYAIAVWRKIEPLVKEARRLENSVLFDDFEKMLPSCYECYVPNLQVSEVRTPFSSAWAGCPTWTA